MNSPVRRREFEADCHRTNNLGDRKRANKFGSQLITHGPERNVLGRKPHFLTNDVDGRLRPVAISLSLGARPHPEESLSGSRPGTVTPLDEGVAEGTATSDSILGKEVAGNLNYTQTAKGPWTTPVTSCERTQPMKVADTRKWDSE